MHPGTRQIVHLDMDAFFVSVERARDPRLNGLPVIVGGRPGSRGVVAAASYEARQFGVQSAMPLAEAQRRCPHAVFLEGAFDRYLGASAAVDEIVRWHSPATEWVSIDEAYLDLTGTARALGHPCGTAERIQAEIRRRLGLDASCGIASSKAAAKIASQLAKPRGLLYVMPGYEARFLAPLRIELLPGVGPRSAARLHDVGVRSLGQLAALAKDVLVGRLGRVGPMLARHAAGLDDSPVLSQSAPRSVSKEATLETDTRDHDVLTGLLHTLAERAAHRLRGQGLFARSVTVKIRYADFVTETRSATLREASSLDDVLVPAARRVFDRLLKGQRAVRLLGVCYSGLIHDGSQLSLFPRRDERQLDSLSRGVDLLRERFGFGAVVSGSALRLSRGRARTSA